MGASPRMLCLCPQQAMQCFEIVVSSFELRVHGTHPMLVVLAAM